jgi:hypothetical protein
MAGILKQTGFSQRITAQSGSGGYNQPCGKIMECELLKVDNGK